MISIKDLRVILQIFQCIFFENNSLPRIVFLGGVIKNSWNDTDDISIIAVKSI